MKFSLPPIGKPPVEMDHFPNRCLAFIFRAYEYLTPERIAKLLKTDAEKVIRTAREMGLDEPCDSDIWLQKGYITIIRRMWHLLPYDQLLELLEMDDQTLAVMLREEDFLDLKLGDKPDCQPLTWAEPTAAEHARMAEICKLVSALPVGGSKPFEFTYDVPPIEFSGKPLFERRIIYPFSCLYQNALEVDSRTFLPDEMLEAYQKAGINGLWIQGVLFQLAEYPFAPEFSKGYEKRLERLKALTERCEKYGIKIYMYINEPRTMEDSFYEKYPHLRGHNAKPGKVCLCTSTKEVQDYLYNSIRTICLAAPKLGGFITISRSENPTNCYSHSTKETCQCPRCSKRSVGEVVAENVNCIEAGAYSVSPDIKVIAWSWSWREANLEIIEHLNPRVILQSKSEEGIPYNIGGVDNVVGDYSMSIPGPGDLARKEWALARSRSMEVSAKVQVNTTWECSTVPALPVYPLIEQHMADLQKEGVSNIMLSWTLGGYPSQNILCAAKHFYESCKVPERSPAQQEASELFAAAFKEFPFSVGVAYMGPQNAGPSTMLYPEPTGYKGTMTCYAYDDVDRWKSIFPKEVLKAQFEKLTEKWALGVERLKDEPDSETKIMGRAAFSTFRSSRNQIRFYMARDVGDIATMIEAAEDEIWCAEELLKMMNLNSAIGFEAANHYYYSKGCLREKVVNCHYVLSKLRAKK